MSEDQRYNLFTPLAVIVLMILCFCYGCSVFRAIEDVSFPISTRSSP